MLNAKSTGLPKHFLPLLCAILAFVGCMQTQALAAKGEGRGTGVTFTTELPTYSTETERVLTFWGNAGEQELEFGDHWKLEQKNGGKWETLTMDANDLIFNDIAYVIAGEGKAKKVYDLSLYAGSLTPGSYRIVADYRTSASSEKHTAYGAFAIVDPQGYVDGSELNKLGLGDEYVDISTGGVLDAATTAHVYVHTKTYHSVLVYEGGKYDLSKKPGGWGVTQTGYIDDGERQYLLYAYSYGEGSGHRSHVAAFDLNKKKIVFRTPAVKGTDLNFMFHDGIYTIFSVDIELVYGVSSSWGAGKEVGKLGYEDGKFDYRLVAAP